MVPISEYRIRDMVKAYNHIRDSYRLMHNNLSSMGVISGEIDIREFKEKEIIAPGVIVKLVETKFGKDVRVKGQTNDIMLARHAMAFLFDKFTILSYREIAPYCGQGHHTTVMNSIKTCSDLMDSNSDYKKQINDMENDLRNYLKRTRA